MDQEEKQPQDPSDYPVKAIPTLDRYNRLYGKTCDGNDRKGVKLFKEYESREMLSRLTRELHAVSQGQVADETCERILGRTRKARFETWPKWARMMLGAASSRG